MGVRTIRLFEFCEDWLTLRVDNPEVDVKFCRLSGAPVYDLVLHGEAVLGRDRLEETFLLARLNMDGHLSLQAESEVRESD